MRILLVDDHELFREGIAALLAAQDGMTVIGEARDGDEGVRLAMELAPDVVVMDITMPVMNGIEATRLLLDRAPGIKVLALSMHTEKRLIVEMLKAGASGYALKEGSFEEFTRALRIVHAGKLYLGADATNTLISDYLALADAGASSPFSNLTERELEVLQGLTEGKTTKEIAFDLDLCSKTVETHRQALMDKLGIHSVAGLTRYAIREGITPA